MNHYPKTPGYKDGDTSREAAEHIAPSAAILREQVYAVLCQKPMTADECADTLGLSCLAVRPRVTELYQLGRIEDSGIRRKNISGRRAKVMRVVGQRSLFE